MAARSLQPFSGKPTFSLPLHPGHLKVPNINSTVLDAKDSKHISSFLIVTCSFNWESKSRLKPEAEAHFHPTKSRRFTLSRPWSSSASPKKHSFVIGLLYSPYWVRTVTARTIPSCPGWVNTILPKRSYSPWLVRFCNKHYVSSLQILSLLSLLLPLCKTRDVLFSKALPKEDKRLGLSPYFLWVDLSLSLISGLLAEVENGLVSAPLCHPHSLRNVWWGDYSVSLSASTKAVLSASLATILFCRTGFKVFLVHCISLSLRLEIPLNFLWCTKVLYFLFI